MYLRKKDNNEVVYPYSIEMLKADNPNVSFPKETTSDILESYGVSVVEPVEKPILDRDEYLEEAVPELINGIWTQVFVVKKRSVEFLADQELSEADLIRKQRNQLLAESDWTQLADSPVDEVAWINYRQALRDITKQAGFPHEITWPQKP